MEVRAQASLIVVASLVAAAVPAVGGTQADRRLVVDLDAELPVPLGQALDEVGGELLRVDDRLGFAVVRAPEDPLESRLGPAVRPDATGRLAVDPPADPRWDDQWGPQALDMPEGWAIQGGDRSVTVAVVDSGMDDTHEDLDDVPVVPGRDYVSFRDDDPMEDPHGHGTHVAGILAAERGNGVGIAGMADVTLHVSRVFDSQNKGWCSDFASAFVDATDAGVDVISFSGYCSAPGFVEDAAAYAAAHDILVVAVTGNFWPSEDSCLTSASPSTAPTVVAVSAIDQTGSAAGFSCRGPYTDLAAPGDHVLSTLPGQSFGSWSGTSMAAPHVSATAALLLSEDPSLSAEEVRAVLLSTADDTGVPGWDPAHGHGVVDPVEALQIAGAAPT